MPEDPNELEWRYQHFERMERKRLETYREQRAQFVEVLTALDGDVCPECRALAGRTFPIDEAPPLPLHRAGGGRDVCRCLYQVVSLPRRQMGS